MVLKNVNEALAATGQGKVANAKSAALSTLGGSPPRIFNHITMAIQNLSIIESAQADLAAERAVVIELVNTNEAEQDHQIAKINGDDDATFEDLDFTPRESLLGYISNAFPVAQYEEYTDDKRRQVHAPGDGRACKPIFQPT